MQQQQAYPPPQYGQPQPMQANFNRPPPPPGAAVQWMPRPQPIPGCPAGLEYLTQIDSLHIQQIPSLLEAFTGWETNNKYVIQNSSGVQVYYAMEDTDACMRQCCGPQRGFKIHIVDNTNQEVMKVIRDFKCCAGCCWCASCCDCCSHELSIESHGQIIGYVKQMGSFWKPKYEIMDDNHKTVLKIEGPCCILDGPCCPCDNEFKILTLDGETQIGKLTKIYAGFVRELVTTADRFGVNFPLDLEVKTKATLIATMFLIDFMFFEKQENNNH